MSFWVLKAVSLNMPLVNKTQMMLMNILMMTFAFSMKDEEDADYEPRVEVRRILTSIPKFPDMHQRFWPEVDWGAEAPDRLD